MVLLTTPALIKVALMKGLFDEPGDERKLHTRRIPTVGGILIFAGTMFSFSFWFPINSVHEYIDILNSVKDLKYIIATILVLFFVGIKDDIIGTAPVKKLIAQMLAALVLVLIADIRVTSLHGIFGITHIPYWASVFLSLFTYIVVVNSFNLIDGVDGLAGGVGLIASFAFGMWFMLADEYIMSTLAFALSGSLLAFLIFNFAPARIFMGDSGSLSIGLILCVLALKMIEYDISNLHNIIGQISKPVYAMAVLVYPLYDTLRVFIYRSFKGLSPFSADKNHLHHRMLIIGLNHKKTVLWIYLFNIVTILLAVITKDLEPDFSFLIVGTSVLLIAQIPFFIKKKKTKYQLESSR
jgi:UDP-GlcNAc:undecaprenyl-phosphate/decaprenyl-phosphate GlcNAc-1-phosphate transferase